MGLLPRPTDHILSNFTSLANHATAIQSGVTTLKEGLGVAKDDHYRALARGRRRRRNLGTAGHLSFVSFLSFFSCVFYTFDSHTHACGLDSGMLLVGLATTTRHKRASYGFCFGYDWRAFLWAFLVPPLSISL